MSNDREELLGSAKINFENLEHAVPAVALHPYYRIAKAQLDEALGGMSVEDRFALDVRRAEKPPIKPFNRSISLTECDDFGHLFKDGSKTCVCGKRKQP